MNKVLVNGYVLVSLDTSGSIYRGPDRALWEKVDDDYYSGRLPPQLHMAYKSIKSDDSRGIWWTTCKTLETVISFAEFENKKNHNVEPLAVWSPYLANTQSCQGWEEPRATLLGFDVISIGEWSLLRAIQECQHGAHCEDFEIKVNKAGLLSNSSSVREVENKYQKLASEGMVEPIAEVNSGAVVESIEVYSLDL